MLQIRGVQILRDPLRGRGVVTKKITKDHRGERGVSPKDHRGSRSQKRAELKVFIKEIISPRTN